ncbi:MAG TPA: SDR family oxidoreductase, partial [Verrucomicrobiae bacterium]|nr:SDR family oxidoreductase [Verrucomicrobiae bacterium]
VRFLEQIEAMYARGVRTFIEVGAGSVLTELVGRILGDREHYAINLDRKGSHGLTSLQIALGRLAVGGVSMELGVLWAPYAPLSDKPAKKPAMAVPVSGVNYGKPYPPAGGAKDLPLPNPPREAGAATMPRREDPAAAQRPIAAVSTPSSDVQHAWVQAYQEAQRQTADAHVAYQRAMAESHMAFLKTTEASFAGLSALLAGESRAGALSLPSASIAVPAPMEFVAPPAVSTSAPIASVTQANISPHAALAPPSIQPSAPTTAPSPAVSVPGANLEALLLEVVSQKTGYPVEMLGSHMDMEADLGIDSIKRVEILSAMSERAPGLRDVKMTEFATLRTLGQIVEHMRVQIGGAEHTKTGTNGSAPKEVKPASVNLEALLLEVVSQKTGYPAEMLGAHMDLESDLGIDSIKRVEILSAMSERTPGLHEVKMTEFATLRTLGQIAEHMRAMGNRAAESKASVNGFMPSNSIAPSAGPANGATSTNGAAQKEVSTPVIHATDIQRFVVRQVATPAVGMAMRGILTADCVWITYDSAGLASLLAREFSRRGVQAKVVAEIPSSANAVVFLGGMSSVESVDAAIAVNRQAFQTGRSLAARFALAKSGVFVTVQDTGGDFGLRGDDCTRAWLGGISALARTAALEWPHVSVKAIDCERAGRDLKAAAQAICTELFEGGSTLEVGLRADGTRITLACAIEAVQRAASPALGPGSIVVASGGARGVTAAALIALAQAHHPRIVLLGRTPLDAVSAPEPGRNSNGAPSNLAEARMAMQTEANVQKAREIRTTLEALIAAGSQARYIEVDVQDGAAVSAALDSVRREWGPITAIVHGAGVLADKRIADKTDDQFDRVFDTKVNGLRALLAATANDPLAAISLFSSVAARTGNPGQCDYAMANEVLNLVACAEQARRGTKCVVRSIGWGPWDGGMVTPGLKMHFKQMGVNVIPLDLGAKIFVDEINSTGADVTLVVGANGQGPLGTESSPAASIEVRVDRQSHPYLDDHRVAGIPVVPVVLALEWMVRGANACRPDLTPTVARNVRVLNGIKLNRFDRAGEVFAINCQPSSDGNKAEITVELRGHTGTLHYSAVVEMAARLPVPPGPPELPDLGPWTQSEIYDGHVLFHRERFQVIRSLDGISNAGIAGVMVGTSEVTWPDEAWRIDPALLDGGLQLAGLWTRQVLGGICLPMALGELRLYRLGLAAGPVRCVVHARKVFDVRAVCDVSFIDPAGSLIAEMRGVETVLRPEEMLSASTAGASRA